MPAPTFLRVVAILTVVSISALSCDRRSAPEEGPRQDAAGRASSQGPLEMYMLILGGGRTKEAADSWLSTNAARVRELEKFVRFSPGYPKVLASEHIQGLKPGFHVVVAGCCDADSHAGSLKAISLALPKAYARKVILPPDWMSCPAPASDGYIGQDFLVRVDGLRMFQRSSVKGRRVGILRWGERIQHLGEQTEGGEDVSLGCEEVKSAWYWVRRVRGKQKGWVPAAGLWPLEEASDAPRGYVVAYHPNPGQASEDWGFFVDDVSQALAKAGVPLTSASKGDENLKCFPLGPPGPAAPIVDLRRHARQKGNLAGYFLFKSAEPYEFVQHDMPNVVLDRAGRTFELDLSEKEDRLSSKPGIGVCIAKKYKQDLADLSQEVVLSITELDCPMMGIQRLHGIERLPNLQVLRVPQNPLHDLRPLASLKNLRELNLSASGVTDLSPLAALHKLEKLDLSGNQVNSLEPLSSLKNLKLLDISWNSSLIFQINELAGFTQLTHLFMAGVANITQRDWYLDLTPLKGLVDLQELDLASNNVRDLGPVGGLTRLVKLVLSKNKFRDLEPLQKLVLLRTLDLDENRIQDLAHLERLTELRHLSLRRCRLKDLEKLRSLTKLTSLNLSYNEISSLDPLKSMKGLEALHLDGCPLKDLGPLRTLSNLKELGLNSLSLSDLNFLSNHKKVEVVLLNFNDIQDLRPLTSLANLRHIEVAGNRIKDLSPLQGIKTLKHFIAPENCIVDKSVLGHVPRADLRFQSTSDQKCR